MYASAILDDSSYVILIDSEGVTQLSDLGIETSLRTEIIKKSDSILTDRKIAACPAPALLLVCVSNSSR